MKMPDLRRSWPLWLFTVGCAALAAAFYREFIGDSATMLYGDDMVNEGYQLRSFGVEEIRSGRGFPLWNPFVYGGQPYLAILPGPVFYPTSLLYLAMPLVRAIGWTFVVHTFLSGPFAYFAARSLGLRRQASVVTGLAFMFTGFVVSTLYGGHDGRMFAMVLIPLAFGTLERGLASGQVKWFLGLGLVIALQIFTPHIQLMYYSSLALTLYAGARIVQRAREEESGRPLAVRLTGLWALAFLVAGLVGAAQLLPTVNILDVAVRGGTGEAGYGFASSWALPPQELSALFLPDLIGSLGTYWGTNPFKLHTEHLGTVPLALAAIALTGFRRDARVAVIASIALVCVAFALGSATPVHRVAYYVVPFVKQFRAPSMMLGPASLMVALLAGLGWQRVLSARDGEHPIPWTWVIGILAPLLLLAVAAAWSPSGLQRWVRTAWFPADWTRQAPVDPMAALRSNGLLLLAGLGVTVGAAWAVARKRAPVWIVACLLALLVADQWRVNTRYLRTVDSADLFPADPVVVAQQEGLETGERSFLAPRTTTYGPGEFAVHRIPSVTGIQKFRLEWYERLTGGLGMTNMGSLSALGLLDVAFIVANPGINSELLTPVAESERGTAYRVSVNPPHAFFPSSVESVTDTAQALRRVLSSDPLELAVVESAEAPAAGAGTARISSYEPNEIVLDVEATSGGLLFLSEVYYPAWRAWIDDVETPVLRTNVAFRGVEVPVGRHEVVLRYSPSEFRLGFLVSGATAAIVVTWLLIGAVRRARRPAGAEV